MKEEVFNIYISTEIMLRAIKNKEPFSQCRKIMDDLFARNLSKGNKTCILRLIYWAINTFSDIEDYKLFFSYLKENGLNADVVHPDSTTSAYNYWLSKYYTGDEKIKETAIRNIELNRNSYLTDSNLHLMPLFLTEDERLIKIAIHVQCILDNSFNMYMMNYMHYFVLKKDVKITRLFLESCYPFRIDEIIETAVENPEIYYGFLAENFFEYLPAIFKSKKKLRTLDNLIPFLFKSKRFKLYITNDFPRIYNDLFIIKYLYNILGSSNFKSIIRYIPKIRFIMQSSIDDIDTFDQELTEYIRDRLDNTVYVDHCPEDYYYGDDDFTNLCELVSMFPDTQFYITYDLLRSYSENTNILFELLKKFRNRIIIDICDDVYTCLIKHNHKGIVTEAVNSSVINKFCYENAVIFAVENRATAAIDVLRKHYDEIMSKDDII